MNIAIQGIKGSFHDIIANKYFGTDIVLNECLSFDEMPNLLIEKKADYVVMEIENSIAGAILANYKLIDEYDLTIVGEAYLPVQHQLMALGKQKIAAIREVWSHPMALKQCLAFLRKYPHIKLIKESDTAASAKWIQEKKLKGIAAIASEKAAGIYNLNIIAANIQTNPANYTRFFILKHTQVTIENFNKASIKFITKHQLGSLTEVLQILLKHQLNLSKIQSLPIIDNPWKYSFFADVFFDDPKAFYTAIRKIKKVVSDIKVLGTYLRQTPTP